MKNILCLFVFLLVSVSAFASVTGSLLIMDFDDPDTQDAIWMYDGEMSNQVGFHYWKRVLNPDIPEDITWNSKPWGPGVRGVFNVFGEEEWSWYIWGNDEDPTDDKTNFVIYDYHTEERVGEITIIDPDHEDYPHHWFD